MKIEDGYIKMGDIIKNLTFDEGEAGTHKYFSYKSHAERFLRQIKRDISGVTEVKTVEIPMKKNKTIELPEDCISWVKIGVRVNDIVRAFLYDETLALFHDSDDCKKLLANKPDGLKEDWGYNFPFGFSNYTGELYGFGPAPKSEAFKINGRTVYFNSDIDTDIVYLEYISSGFCPTEQSLVPAQMESALRSYVLWQYWSHRDSPRGTKAVGWHEQYANDIRLAIKAMSVLTIADVYNVTGGDKRTIR